MSAIRKTWRVEGMHCPRCETAVRRALLGAAGISEIEVSFQKGTLSALWDAKLLPESDINARLREAGYSLIRGSSRAAWLGDTLRLLAALAAAWLLYLLLTRTAVAGWTRAFPTAREGMGLGALFAVGLATSLHCVAMCGGINLAQSAASVQRGAKPARANLLYNLGRLCSYTLTGGIVGALGTALSVSGAAKAAIQIFAAAFMLLMALNLLGGFAWLRRLTPRLPESLSAWLFGRFAGKSSFTIGLANGLMPCGPLQAMQLYALSAGSWWRGALSMFCFCLGTIPLMLGVGLVSGKLNARFAKPMRYASAALVLAMGVSALASGLALAGVDVQGVAPAQLRAEASSSAEEPSGEDGAAVIRDGVQYVRSELGYGGYPAITVRAGIPVEWTIHADANHLNSCNSEIYIPKFDLSVPLEPGDNRICFTPDAAGTIPYTCWMGMIQSAIYVLADEAEEPK